MSAPLVGSIRRAGSRDALCRYGSVPVCLVGHTGVEGRAGYREKVGRGGHAIPTFITVLALPGLVPLGRLLIRMLLRHLPKWLRGREIKRTFWVLEENFCNDKIPLITLQGPYFEYVYTSAMFVNASSETFFTVA